LIYVMRCVFSCENPVLRNPAVKLCYYVLRCEMCVYHVISAVVLVFILQYIERLKKDSRERLSWWLAIKEVFGHPFSYRWFSPIHSGPPSTVEVDELYAVL